MHGQSKLKRHQTTFFCVLKVLCCSERGEKRMMKGEALLYFLRLAFVFTLSHARHPISLPQPLRFFKTNTTQDAGLSSSCSYKVKIVTSCSSTKYTRDQISLAFGDAYGYQVYAPRLDDPSSRTFESCSTDTFEINGPCTYQICYLYLYRSGYDGWKPKSVTVYGTYSSSVTFYYDTFIPNGVWYGFNHCNGALASS